MANKTTATSQTSQLWSHRRSFEITLHMCCNSPKLCWLPFHRVKSRNSSASKIKRKLNCYASLSQNLRKQNHFSFCERGAWLRHHAVSIFLWTISIWQGRGGRHETLVNELFSRIAHWAQLIIHRWQDIICLFSQGSETRDERGGIWRESVIMLSKGPPQPEVMQEQHKYTEWLNYARLLLEQYSWFLIVRY